MHEIQPLERMGFLDATIHVHAAVLAGVAEDHGRRVDDVEVGGVGDDGEVVDWDDGHDGEEGAGRFPAFGAAAGVVVEDVAFECHADRVRGAVAC